MQKKRVVRAAVLTGVFVLAMMIFSYFTNQGNMDMSAEMESAALPILSFTTEGREVNTLMGYVSDMELTSMRDTITPVKDYTLTMRVEGNDQEIQKVSWQIYTIDGKECVQKETIRLENETIKLKINSNGMLNNEKILKVILHLPSEDVYYYTRLVDSKKCNYDKCLAFADFFHTSSLHKQNKDQLLKYLNKAPSDSSTGFQRVTLKSGLDRITWGKLEPEVVGDVRWNIKECNEAYTSLLLSYQVKCGEEGMIHDVEEFYRIRIYGDDKVYLMDYVREMEQRFDGKNSALDSQGILLGIASNVEYKDSPDGNCVAFVQDNELWHYDREDDEFSLVFSFADAEKIDIRNCNRQHEIHISSLEENGNVLFYVMGYMNRGTYEGKVGVAVYYFDSDKNSVEEKAFVPSRKGYEIMKGELGQFVHYSKDMDMLYVMADGCLYQVDMKEDVKDILVRGLAEGQYMVSDDGKLLVYQNTFGGSEKAEQIKLLNLENGEGFTVTAEEGDYVKPIGFIRDDLVYGFVNAEEEGRTRMGEVLLPMYKMLIVDEQQNLVKEYRPEGSWIQEVSIEENVLEIKRVIRSDEYYQETSKDYITSNEELEERNIQLSYFGEEKRGRVARLQFQDGISDLEAKVLKPKQMIQEHRTEVKVDEAKMQGKYYVYALGGLQKTFEQAGEAVTYANDIQGVAVSSAQRYIFVRGNWPNAYEIPGLDGFSVEENETSMKACLKKIFQKEGAQFEGETDMAGKTPLQCLNELPRGEGLELSGCSMEELQYLISRNLPVIAVIDEERAVLLIGYNKTNVAYLDPTEGKKVIVTKERMEQMLSDSGGLLFGYTR